MTLVFLVARSAADSFSQVVFMEKHPDVFVGEARSWLQSPWLSLWQRWECVLWLGSDPRPAHNRVRIPGTLADESPLLLPAQRCPFLWFAAPVSPGEYLHVYPPWGTLSVFPQI